MWGLRTDVHCGCDMAMGEVVGGKERKVDGGGRKLDARS